MSEAFICSGVLLIVATRFRKAFVLDISFRNGAAISNPNYGNHKNEGRILSPTVAGKGLHL